MLHNIYGRNYSLSFPFKLQALSRRIESSFNKATFLKLREKPLDITISLEKF